MLPEKCPCCNWRLKNHPQELFCPGGCYYAFLSEEEDEIYSEEVRINDFVISSLQKLSDKNYDLAIHFNKKEILFLHLSPIQRLHELGYQKIIDFLHRFDALKAFL